MRPAVLLGVLLGLCCTCQAYNSLRHFFDVKLDNTEQDGFITPQELRVFLYYMDNEGGYAPIEPVTLFHSSLDVDGDGLISWDEFRRKYRALDHETDGVTNPPEQIHLALTDQNTEMVVMWAASRSKIPTVRYGTTSNLGSSTTGTSKTYSVNGGLWTSMPISTVTLTGLTPDQFYYYQCGDAAPGGLWSGLYNFTTAPAYSPAPASVTWAVFGDMGTVIPLGYAVTQQMVTDNDNERFNMALHLGDLAYAGVSSGKWEEWEPTWDVWMNQIQPLASVVPYQVTVGNHESYYNFEAYMNRFSMPGAQSQGNGSFWFSFQYGNIHMTVMDTESPYDPTSVQYEWMEADLAAARANPTVTWVFVSGHRPYYSSDKSEYESHSPGGALLVYLEPLLIKYKVDMVLTGHMHCYERTYPTFNGTVNVPPGSHNYTNPTYPIYIVQGTAGAFIGETWIDPQPVWSAKRLQHYGYARLTVSTDGGDSLRYAYYDVDHPTTVLDELWIYKN